MGEKRICESGCGEKKYQTKYGGRAVDIELLVIFAETIYLLLNSFR
jgi:hypothetical protein